MGHHSYLTLNGHHFLFCRDGYSHTLAALFLESDRRLRQSEEGTEFRYVSTASALKDRLQVQGFTAAHARTAMEDALIAWGTAPTRAEVGPAPTAQEIDEAARRTLSAHADGASVDEMLASTQVSQRLETLSYFMDDRSYTRWMLDHLPHPHIEVDLRLNELTGCCVGLDPSVPVAGQAREAQLAALTPDAPLLVITEGVTDARLLAASMEITHPHLTGFVSFMDFGGAGGGTERGVGGLVRVVSAFIAAGVIHRFIGIADNDAAARSGLAKLKAARVPDRCRILHYPHLTFLESYPALGTDSDEPVLNDVNGRAGSLEMYFGRDVLMGNDDCLMPVRWSGWDPKLQCYQGSLADHDKKEAQRRFEAKITAVREGRLTGEEDWEGVRAIIDSIVAAYD